MPNSSVASCRVGVANWMAASEGRKTVAPDVADTLKMTGARPYAEMRERALLVSPGSKGRYEELNSAACFSAAGPVEQEGKR